MFFSTNGTGTTGYSQVKEWSWTFAIHYTWKLKGSRNLNLSIKTIKPVEENIGVNLFNLGLGNGFLDMTSKAHTTKEKHKSKH